jgi:hypothetical protein
MYHRRKTIKMRQEADDVSARQSKMMQWRHKPKQSDTQAYAEKRK